MSDKMKTLRDQMRASAEAQLGRGMGPEAQALVDAACEGIREGADLVALHQTLARLHAVMASVQEGTVAKEEALAAVRMTMTAMERGEDTVEALERHLSPLLPQEACL